MNRRPTDRLPTTSEAAEAADRLRMKVIFGLDSFHEHFTEDDFDDIKTLIIMHPPEESEEDPGRCRCGNPNPRHGMAGSSTCQNCGGLLG